MEDIKILEFYPTQNLKKKSQYIGSLTIRCESMGLEFRSVQVICLKKGVIVNMPGSTGKDKETNKKVRFSFVSFIDKEKGRLFMNKLAEETIKFLKIWFVKNSKNEEVFDHGRVFFDSLEKL